MNISTETKKITTKHALLQTLQTQIYIFGPILTLFPMPHMLLAALNYLGNVQEN